MDNLKVRNLTDYRSQIAPRIAARRNSVALLRSGQAEMVFAGCRRMTAVPDVPEVSIVPNV